MSTPIVFEAKNCSLVRQLSLRRQSSLGDHRRDWARSIAASHRMIATKAPEFKAIMASHIDEYSGKREGRWNKSIWKMTVILGFSAAAAGKPMKPNVVGGEHWKYSVVLSKAINQEIETGLGIEVKACIVCSPLLTQPKIDFSSFSWCSLSLEFSSYDNGGPSESMFFLIFTLLRAESFNHVHHWGEWANDDINSV